MQIPGCTFVGAQEQSSSGGADVVAWWVAKAKEIPCFRGWISTLDLEIDEVIFMRLAANGHFV